MKQTDALIIADALRYLVDDEERHELDRKWAKHLREQILDENKPIAGSTQIIETMSCQECKWKEQCPMPDECAYEPKGGEDE